MRELTESGDLKKFEATYPHVRKIVIDDENEVAYVFTGRSLQGRPVRGEEFSAFGKTTGKTTVKTTGDTGKTATGKVEGEAAGQG